MGSVIVVSVSTYERDLFGDGFLPPEMRKIVHQKKYGFGCMMAAAVVQIIGAITVITWHFQSGAPTDINAFSVFSLCVAIPSAAVGWWGLLRNYPKYFNGHGCTMNGNLAVGLGCLSIVGGFWSLGVFVPAFILLVKAEVSLKIWFREHGGLTRDRYARGDPPRTLGWWRQGSQALAPQAEAPDTKFCGTCGKVIKRTAQFCEHCGASQ